MVQQMDRVHNAAGTEGLQYSRLCKGRISICEDAEQMIRPHNLRPVQGVRAIEGGGDEQNDGR